MEKGGQRQRVVVIQDDACNREIRSCSSAMSIRWALHGLSLKPGDSLTLLAVVHHVNTPPPSSTFSFIGGWKKSIGYRSRVESSSILGTNDRTLELEAVRKKEEYKNNLELIQISKLYQMQQVEFRIEVAVGPSQKEVALKSAQNLMATWIILDRQMKKDRKYFLERLSCGISRVKRNNTIERLRGPKGAISDILLKNRNSCRVSYDEMMPGSPEEEEDDDDLFSIELFPTSC